MSSRTPNFYITTSYEELPQGAMVRPVHDDYVPAETKKTKGRHFSSWESPSDYAWCYTAKGFMLIPWRIIKEN